MDRQIRQGRGDRRRRLVANWEYAVEITRREGQFVFADGRAPYALDFSEDFLYRITRYVTLDGGLYDEGPGSSSPIEGRRSPIRITMHLAQIEIDARREEPTKHCIQDDHVEVVFCIPWQSPMAKT